MRRVGFGRRTLSLFVGVLCISAMASTAAGASPAAPRTAGTSWSSVAARIGRFQLPDQPIGTAVLGAEPTAPRGLVQLTTYGRRIVRAGVRYWLFLNVNQDGPPGSDIQFVDVILSRRYGHGASQTYFYEFQTQQPFPYDGRTLQRARFDSRAQMGSSVVSVRYRASGPVRTTTCELFNGKTGVHKVSRGTLSFSAFSIRTGTKPFFGTITERPVRAALIYDLHCMPPGRDLRPVCPSAVSLGAVGRDPNGGPILYADGPGPAQAGTTENIVDGKTIFHGEWPENIYRSAQAPVSDADLPPPVWDVHSASASLSTDGFIFGSGAGTFTSHAMPDVRYHRICRVDGVKHVYSSYRFRGTFVADPRFVAHFVTGDRSLPTRSQGDLFIAEYAS
jgi:hypothetical protein